MESRDLLIRTPVRWGRGFFRLWAVGGTIWILLIAGVSWNNVMNPYLSPAAYLDSRDIVLAGLAPLPKPLPEPGPWTFEYRTDSAPYRILADRVAQGKLLENDLGYHGMTVLTLPQAANDEKLERVDNATAVVNANVRGAQWGELKMIAAISLIPPAAILLLGWAIAWALSGFRRFP